MTLNELSCGAKGLILSVGNTQRQENDRIVERLLEMGFLEGSRFEVKHEAPWGRDPMAVQVRGALLSLRRKEAELIEVELDS